ncbi:MAG TPA: SPFH domain-containing protein [Fimbriimonadaceae bacterium]|jgi:regulator of protease activity HflC (stomatin/prohibitin superfamily)
MKNKALAFAIFCLAISGCSYKKIEPAQVGILFDANSGISEKILKPQVTLVGFRQRLITYPTSIKNASFVSANNEGQRTGEDSIKASTIEGAILPTDVTVAWHVAPENVVTVFQNFGTSDQEQMTNDFIRYFATYAVNCVSGSKSIFDLMAKERQQFGPDVKAFLAPILFDYGITVDDVYIGEVHPPAEIQSKAQERIARKNDLENAKIQLQKANLDAQTIITNAKRDAQLNQLKAQMANDPAALALRKKQQLSAAIEKWDGEPQVVGSDTIPFTDLHIKG